MANHAEIALFFRLALRVGIATPAEVERWVDAVLESEREVNYPMTELIGLSQLPRGRIDELLGEFPGPADKILPGLLVMALIGRRLQAEQITPEDAAKIGRAVGSVGDLPEGEYENFDGLDDEFYLASTNAYGNVETVRREVRAFFKRYSAYEKELPKTI